MPLKGKEIDPYNYKGNENSGEMLFRIENISRLSIVSKESKAGLGLK